MDQAAIYCTVGGVCYDLASKFLINVPWNKVLKDSVVTSAKKVWSSRNAYSIVLKEAALAKKVFDAFKNTIRQMDDYQRRAKVSVCSLAAAKSFITDYGKVLEMYHPENIQLWQSTMAGEGLRQQLQYYTLFLHSMMSSVMLDVSSVTMQLHAVSMEKDPQAKERLMQELRGICMLPGALPESTDSTPDVFYMAPESFTDGSDVPEATFS